MRRPRKKVQRWLYVAGAVVGTGLGLGIAATTTGPSGPTTAGQYPIQSLTPGAFNPNVTQDTISTTICVSGWTSTVRPPTSYTNKLKNQQIIQYGYADKNPSDYEEDHLVPLELGGAPSDPSNLWPEPHTWSFTKDKDENTLHAQICSGQITLAQARDDILSKWGPRLGE